MLHAFLKILGGHVLFVGVVAFLLSGCASTNASQASAFVGAAEPFATYCDVFDGAARLTVTDDLRLAFTVNALLAPEAMFCKRVNTATGEVVDAAHLQLKNQDSASTPWFDPKETSTEVKKREDSIDTAVGFEPATYVEVSYKGVPFARVVNFRLTDLCTGAYVDACEIAADETLNGETTAPWYPRIRFTPPTTAPQD